MRSSIPGFNRSTSCVFLGQSFRFSAPRRASDHGDFSPPRDLPWSSHSASDLVPSAAHHQANDPVWFPWVTYLDRYVLRLSVQSSLLLLESDLRRFFSLLSANDPDRSSPHPSLQVWAGGYGHHHHVPRHHR